MKKIVFILTLVIAFVSCNEKSQKNNVETKKPQVKREVQPLKVLVNFTANHEGKMTVVFDKIEHKTASQSMQYKIFKNFKKNKNTFEAQMFSDLWPELVQIDFGRKEENEFMVESILISYEDSTITVNKNELKKYFYINKFLKYDETDGKLMTKRINKSLAPIITIKKTVLNGLFEK